MAEGLEFHCGGTVTKNLRRRASTSPARDFNPGRERPRTLRKQTTLTLSEPYWNLQRIIPAMRVHLTNLGCKLNQAEVERLGRQFETAGHRVVGSLAEADLHVVNSCTVTHAAARESRKAAGRARRSGRPLRTVLTGCYASGSPEEAARLAGVDLVVP